MYLPIADTGDCSDGVIITVMGKPNVLPDNITPISTYPIDSDTVNFSDVKLNVAVHNMYHVM